MSPRSRLPDADALDALLENARHERSRAVSGFIAGLARRLARAVGALAHAVFRGRGRKGLVRSRVLSNASAMRSPPGR
jgi:hypothetical protein